MKHRDDRRGFRFVYEIDGIWKLVKQSASHFFFYNWKPKRRLRDVFE